MVLVALGDDLLSSTHKELSEQYPRVTFRKVGEWFRERCLQGADRRLPACCMQI